MIKTALVVLSALVTSLALPLEARAACKLTQLVELPVGMQQGRATVAATINGSDAVFVVDSGAFFSVVTPANAAKYGLSLTPAAFGASVQGVTGATDLEIGKARKFSLKGIPFDNMTFVVAGGEIGADSAGVLGQNFLRLGDAEYDLANGAIRLMRAHDCGHSLLAYWAKPDQPYAVISIEPTTIGQPHTRGDVFVNGVRLRAMFDTGAPSSVMTRRGAARAGVTPDTPGVTADGYSSGIGRRLVKDWIAPIESFKIGDEETRHTRLRFAEIDLGDADMLVGIDFFLSHRVYVATSQEKLYATYNGGAVFDTTSKPATPPTSIATTAAPDTAETLDAAGYSRRGVAHLARREFDPAIADLTRAISLAPKDPSYLYERAQARSAAGRPLLARADLDAALELAPDDARAHVFRAGLELRDPDKSRAVADYDAAARVGAPQDDVRLTIASGYVAAERPAAAIPQFDLWIASHREDARMPVARNGRCWARALAGQDLARALDDCNAAMRTTTQTANTLDSRGLVYLRLGKFDKAIADYDAALRMNPKIAWSLYGRGVAELHTGQDARAAADLAAADALAPAIARLAKGYGIAPEAK